MSSIRTSTGSIRIVAGRHRGRKLIVPTGSNIRPTAERIREAIFNVLSHNHWRVTEGPLPRRARVLDAFAGSGALGLEALSRGASEVLLLDPDRAARAAIESNIDTLDETGQAFVAPRDATLPGPMPGEARFALVLADAPYGSGLAAPALAAFAKNGWLEDGAVAAVELNGKEPWEPPPGFTTADERRYGRTRLVFLEWG